MRNHYKVPVIVLLLFKFLPLFSSTYGKKESSEVFPNKNKQAKSTQSASLKDNPIPKTSRKMDCGIVAPNIVNYGCLDLIWQKDYKLVNSNYVQTLESPKKIYPTNDGGYIFASNSQFQPNNSGDSEYAIFKVDANGNRLWSKTFGTVDKDFLTAFVPTSDGGYVLGGYSEGGINRDKTSASKGSNDIWLIKINANGTKIWDKTFGGADQDLLASMIATSDGGFLLGGYSSSGNNGDKTDPYIGGYYDSWILKIDGSGNKVWDKTFGGTGYDATRVVAETTDGYIIGTQSSSGVDGNKTSASKGNTDFWVLKVDFNGTKIWDNSYGGSNIDIPQAINKNADGSLIISGYSNSPISGDKSQKARGLDDVWILKISSSGTKVWDKTIGGSNKEYVTSATTTPTGNIIFNVDSYSNISGDKKRTPVAPNTTDQWLFEITPDGVQLWERYLNGNYGFLTGSGDLIVHNNHLISLENTDYSIARQYDFWNIGLKKISYCNAQTITSTTICQGKCATLVAENCSSGVVKWSNGEYGASICASPNATRNYKSVCLSADSLCVGDSSAVFTVNVTPSDVVSISPAGFVDITACGTSQTITSTGCVNGTLSWSNGQTGNPITFIPTNNQIVKAICTMPNGCVSESSYLSISVNNISAPDILGRPSVPVCAGQPLTLSTSCLSGGTANWTGGLTGSSITINPTSTFTMRVACSYPSGCVSDSSRSFPSDTIKVLARPVAPTIVNYSCLKKVWDKRFGGADGPDYEPKLLKVNGGYLLAGTSRSSNSGDRTDVNRGGTQNNTSADYWIIKVDDNGNKLWDKAYGGSGDEFLSNIILLSDGNYMISGWSNSGIGGEKSEASRGGKDYWIVKIDANGNKIWDKTYGGSGDESLYNNAVDIKETSDGFILGGSSISGVGGDKTLPAITNGYYHFWILKLNQQGGKVWEKTFGGTGGEMFTSLEVLGNSEYLLFGQSQSPANATIGNKASMNKGNSDYWLVKIDSNGNKIWDKSYGGTGYDYSKSMAYTNDGKITMVGQSASPKSFDKSRSQIGPFGEDIWIIQVDTSGTKIWDKTYGGYRYEYTGKMCITPKTQSGFIITASSDSEKGYDKSENPRKDYYENNTSDYWIFEINENGEKVWDKTFGGNNGEAPTNVIVENNAIIIGGVSWSGLSGDKSQFNNGPGNFWLVKMNYCQPNVINSIILCKNDSTFLTAQSCPNASTVKWSNGETVQTISVKPSVTTTYKAICISTDGGCQSDSSLVFTVNVTTTLPPTITSSNTSICQSGGSVTLTASGCAGTYGWTGGATTSSITVSPVATKTYKLACISNGCKSDSASVTITVATPARPTLSISSQSICAGTSATITASGCTGGTYSWTGGLTGSSITVSPSATKSYKALCTIGTCVSDSSLVSTITVNPIPSIPVINPPNPSSICAGNTVSLSVNNPLVSGTYRWTGGFTGTSITVSPNSSKSYKAIVFINNCASDSSSAVTITVQSKPIVTLTPSTTSPICNGQSVTITASGCSTGTYAWTGGLTGTSITVTPSSSRAYKSACMLNGCTSDSASVNITVSQSPPLPVTTGSSICQGSTLTVGNGLKSTSPNCSGGASNLTATYSGGVVGYDGGSSSGSNPTATISGMSSTITKVVVSTTWIKKGGGNHTSCGVAHNGGSPFLGEASFKIQAPNGTQITLVPSGSYTGSYVGQVTTTFDDAATMALSSTPSTGSFRPSSPLSGFNGLTPNGVWTLIPNDSGGSDPLCVSGFSVTITTSGSTSTITWWNAQIDGSQVGSGTEYLPTTNTLAAGTYTYYAQINCAGLCPSNRVSAILTVNAKPSTPTISANNSSICSGSSAVLIASGCAGGNYAWTGGLTGSSVTVSPTVTKSYKAACTINGCVGDSSAVNIVTVFNSMYSIKTGNWEDVSTWSCNRIPLTTDDVTVSPSHVVTINDANAVAKNLNNKSQLLMANVNSQLTIYGVQTISFMSQPDASSGKDAYIADDTPNSNFGNAVYIHPYLGATFSANGNPVVLNRALLSFDMSSIPSNAVIDSAFITLYYSQAIVNVLDAYYSSRGYTQWTGHVGNNSMFIQRITQSWMENTVTWNNQPSVSLVNRLSIPNFTNYRQNYKIDVKSLAQDMLINHATSYGFMIKLQDEVSGNFALSAFASSDETNSVLRPKFQVYYHLP
jgi:Ig-like domain CHU_C associated